MSEQGIPESQVKGQVLKDVVTSHKMSLLVLIQEYCVGVALARMQILFDADDVYSERDERELLFMLLQLLQSADTELKDLVSVIQDVAKPKLAERVLQKLHELNVDGVRAIMDLFSTVADKLFKEPTPLLHKSSVLGLFVRRMILSFEKLSFSQVRTLHGKYQTFYEAWQQTQKTDAAGTGILDIDGSQLGDASLSIIEIMGDPSVQEEKLPKLSTPSVFDAGRFSQRQAELFIAQQASLLEYNESEALSAKDLQEKVSELLSSNPDLAEAHYLSYLNNLRVNEYCGAVNSLYHYFDRHTPTSHESNTAGNRIRSDEDPASRGLRYAALNMAALHFRFGHHKEALAAVQETINLAQEANDPICLQHSLSWLQRLNVQSTSKSAFMLDRLVTKSSELNLPYLMSLGVQCFAKHNAVAASQPSSIFDFLLRSDIFNCQCSMSDVMSTSYAHKAALWQIYGNSEMCSLNSQILLHLNTSTQSVYHNAEAECLGMCHLARVHAQQGDYRTALLILSTAKSRFPPNTQFNSICLFAEQLLLFERAMYNGRWSAAELAIDSMAAIDEMEARYCKARLLKERGEIDECLAIIQSLLALCLDNGSDDGGQPHLQARLFLLQGALQSATGNPTNAGQPLLSCLTLAKEHHFSHLVAMANAHLAYVQFCLQMPEQAEDQLDGTMLYLLTHAGLYDRACAQYLWVRCHVAAASRKLTDKQPALFAAVKILTDVINWFREIEAYYRMKDVIYYQARLYHELGYVSERNKCALDFRQLDEQYPTWNKTSILSL